MKRPRLLLAVILLAVITLLAALWVNEGPLWRWVMLEKVMIQSPARYLPRNSPWTKRVAGFKSINRWTKTEHGRLVFFDLESGRQVQEQVWSKGSCIRITKWSPRGTLYMQSRTRNEFGETIPAETTTSPPWWWGVENQTEPTAPWWGKE